MFFGQITKKFRSLFIVPIHHLLHSLLFLSSLLSLTVCLSLFDSCLSFSFTCFGVRQNFCFSIKILTFHIFLCESCHLKISSGRIQFRFGYFCFVLARIFDFFRSLILAVLRSLFRISQLIYLIFFVFLSSF